MPAGGVDLRDFDVLTFDCYGTLIDWEAGILEALREARPDGWPMPGEALLERFATHEAAAERGTYRPYRDVLAEAIRGIARDGGVEVTAGAVRRFASSVAGWPPFPDSAGALRRVFETAMAEIAVPRNRILHVAQSLYHDHVPAKAMGLFTVWIDRRGGRAGHGATPPAEARPDLAFPTMEAFADVALQGRR